MRAARTNRLWTRPGTFLGYPPTSCPRLTGRHEAEDERQDHSIQKDYSMRMTARALFTTLAPVLVLATSLVLADDGPKHGAPLHGGKVTMTKEYHFEVVCTKDGLKVYPRSHEDRPLDASKVTGTAIFYHPNSPKPWFERKLTATAASLDKASSSIETSVDLSTVPATGAKVDFKIDGLPEAEEKTATFTVPFALASSNELVVAKATKDDEKAIAAMKTCAVSKEDLGSMGGPLKVTRGDKSTFICCKGCLKAVQANPDKFFGAKAPSEKGEHAAHDH